MCDYSLGGLPNRLAVDGEELRVHRFRTGSMGLASTADLHQFKPTETPLRQMSLWSRIKSFFAEHPHRTPNTCAVCVPPGAQLIVKNIPADLQHRWCVGPEEEVRFMQCSADVNRYRDCVQFKNQRQVLLQEMREGMCVQVVSLGGTESSDEHDLAMSRKGDRIGSYL
jgi:hypothetical protein